MKVAEAQGWPAAMEYGTACYEEAGRLCSEGLAHCLGEVGRAHFEVPATTQAHLNELLQYAMGIAKDAGVPIMLHTEHTEPATMAEFAAMADRAGLSRERVIKHYCGPLVQDHEHHGLIPSVICGRSNLRAALKGSPAGRFLLETDYIDEPTRPNVVMPPDTVPKRVLGLLANGELSEAQAHAIGQYWPERLYG
jgi:TatD-related deoxyribonuclease